MLYGQWVICQARGDLQQAERYSEEIYAVGCVRNDMAWKY